MEFSHCRSGGSSAPPERERSRSGDQTNRTAAISVVQEAVHRELRRRPILQPPVVFEQTWHIA